MISKIKRGIIPIFLAIICGSICGKLVCSIYVDSASKSFNDTKIYLIQAGAYSTYDSMVSNTSVNNYVYYEDDGLYKAIIGITENKNNIDKIKSTYEGEVIVSEYYSLDNKLNEEIEKYDKKIEKLEDSNEIKNIVIEMLGIYKDNDNNTLVYIN